MHGSKWGGGGIPSFLRDHLFVTTRVAVRDGNFLIGAPFVSDRPRHLFFRPNKSVLGPVDVCGPCSTILAIFSELLIFENQEIAKNVREQKCVLRGAAG